MTTLIEAGTDEWVTAYRNPMSRFVPNPGEVLAFRGDAENILRVLDMKRGQYWKGYGSPTAEGVFLAMADNIEPWMVPVESGDEPWVAMTPSEIREMAG